MLKTFELRVSLPELSSIVDVELPLVKLALMLKLSLPAPPWTTSGIATVPFTLSPVPLVVSLPPPRSRLTDVGVTVQLMLIVFSPVHDASAAIVTFSVSFRANEPGPADTLMELAEPLPVYV